MVVELKKNSCEPELVQGTFNPVNKQGINVCALGDSFPVLDWTEIKDLNDEIYSLSLNSEIIGLIWMYNIFGHVEIGKIEVSKKQVENRLYKGIAGTLIGFACNWSLERYNGVVKLIAPNLKLQAHYANKYGFVQEEIFMTSSSKNSKQLIERYLRVVV